VCYGTGGTRTRTLPRDSRARSPLRHGSSELTTREPSVTRRTNDAPTRESRPRVRTPFARRPLAVGPLLLPNPHASIGCQRAGVCHPKKLIAPPGRLGAGGAIGPPRPRGEYVVRRLAVANHPCHLRCPAVVKLSARSQASLKSAAPGWPRVRAHSTCGRPRGASTGDHGVACWQGVECARTNGHGLLLLRIWPG
jgi:hypothetical protein